MSYKSPSSDQEENSAPDSAQAPCANAAEIAQVKAKDIPAILAAMSPARTKKAFHELLLRQIDLEIENETLRRAQQLQHEKLTSIGKDTANIVNDLDRMLAVILHHAETALPPATPLAKQQGHLANIAHQARLANELIQQILELHRGMQTDDGEDIGA